MRVLVADHRSRARIALCVLLQRPGLKVVGEAINPKGLLFQTKTARPDLVLLDWELQDSTASNLLSALRKICPQLCIVVFNGYPEARRSALEIGVDVFVSRSDPPERLITAVDDCWRRNLKPPTALPQR